MPVVRAQSSGQYGSGLVFMPLNQTKRRILEARFAQIVQSEGQQLLGWRTVPTDNSSLGDTAKASEPFMRQVFIGRDPSLTDDMAFERKLYVIRKRMEHAVDQLDLGGAGLKHRFRFVPAQIRHRSFAVEAGSGSGVEGYHLRGLFVAVANE